MNSSSLSPRLSSSPAALPSGFTIDHSPLPWKRLLLPTEHGSWALTFEPIVLGLCISPSLPAGLIASASAGFFLARKPMKLGWGRTAAKTLSVRHAARVLGTALGALGCVSLAAGCLLSEHPLPVFLPFLLGTPLLAYFARCEQRGETRTFSAEAVGTLLCALPLVAITLASGRGLSFALLLAGLNLSRALPTFLLVRNWLRRAKGENVSLSPALGLHTAALLLWGVLAVPGHAPLICALSSLVLLVRAVILENWPGELPSARQIGMSETILGVVLVALQALTLR